MLKAVFHVDEVQKWSLVLKNVDNFIHYLQQNDTDYEITVVANSEAVRYYEDHINSAWKRQMQDLSSLGVCFTACSKALMTVGLDEDSVFKFVEVVQSGIAELVIKQSQGFAYIKP